MSGDKIYCKTLQEAIRNNDVGELERLVQQGCCDVNDVDKVHQFSSLHWAAHFGSLECIHWLLCHGANVNMQTEQGWTAAHIAAIRGRDSCLLSLLSNNVNINQVDNRGKTIAHLAASHGNTSTLQEIFRKGCDVDLRDNYGWTVAHTAAYHGRLACLQVAYKWSCDLKRLDDNGNTVGHLCASEGHLSCLKYLLSITQDAKSFLKARNDQGETLKDVAMQFFKDDCISYLKQIEYDVDHPEDHTENFSFPAHASAYKGDLDYLKTVIETGVASINDNDEKASTPAHKAAGNGQVAVLKWLIENGANLNALNAASETPKDVAIRFGQLACIKLLGGDSDEDVINEEEDIIPNVTLVTADTKRRAKEKVETLRKQLAIAKLNYQQFGGVLKEDQMKLKQEEEQKKIVTMLNQQLEYERLKREKLECQLDSLKIQAHNLTVQLEDTREQLSAQAFVISKDVSPNQMVTTKKKMKKKRNTRPGIFLVKRSVNTLDTSSKPVPPPPKPPSSLTDAYMNKLKKDRPQSAFSLVGSSLSSGRSPKSELSPLSSLDSSYSAKHSDGAKESLSEESHSEKSLSEDELSN